jgi:hypothetical protein
MTTEFNLSSKLQIIGDVDNSLEFYEPKDVKEFIRLLRLRHCYCIDNKELEIKAKCRLCIDLDRLSGEKLT